MKKFALSLVMGLFAAACATKPSEPVVYQTYPYSDAMSVRAPADTGAAIIRLDTHGRRFADLEKCEGRAQLFDTGENRWQLRIRNATCANINLYDRDGRKTEDKKLAGANRDRYVDVDLVNNSGRTAIFKVEIESNSGKSKDTFYITVRPEVKEITNGQAMALEDCGGYVVAKKSSDGSVHVNFKDVKYCKYFDIVGDEDGKVSYPAKYFGNQDSPSYTLPKQVMSDWGPKRVLIQVRSENGILEDKFYVRFFNW